MAGKGGYREGSGRKSRFDTYDYRRMKKMRDKGVSVKDICKIYNVHNTYMYLILRKIDRGDIKI